MLRTKNKHTLPDFFLVCKKMDFFFSRGGGDYLFCEDFYTFPMYLVINPSDIFFLTGVRIHEVGEVMILYRSSDEVSSPLPTPFVQSKVPSPFSGGRLPERKSIVLCDPRTSGLFDPEKYTIVDQREQWKEILSTYKDLATDADFLTQSLREKIELYGPRLTMSKSPITEQRVIKNAHEIELLRTSQQMNLEVFEKIVPLIVPGMTEEQVARKIQILQLELGASGPSFPPIVAFGEHTAIPHHSPTERVLENDEPILIDMGLVYQGYCSDMTRCIQIGKN